MQKEINFYQEMASEHRLQEYCRGSVPLCLYFQADPYPKIWIRQVKYDVSKSVGRYILPVT